MSATKIFVSRQIPAVGLERLRQHFEVDLWPENGPPSRQELLQRVVGCSGILSLLSDRIDEEVFACAGPQLRVVSNYAVGYNNIDIEAAAARGIRVGNTPDVLTDATADMAVCLLLAAARHLKPAIDNVRLGRWSTWEPLGFLGSELAGKTLGVIGGGRIGSAMAKRCHGGWGMRILYASRGSFSALGQTTWSSRVPLDQLLQESDFISIHCDLNEQTKHLINRQTLQMMKQGAILINTARGQIVDQDALCEALLYGPLGAAGLDVTDPEPLPPEHPLVGLDNCLILPHIGSATHQARDAMSRIAAENIIAAITGVAMPAEVARSGQHSSAPRA